MANLTLELNIYSAKDLENVNLITKMDVYAVASIIGHDFQIHKERTAVDRTGGSEPTWDHAVKFSLDQRLAREGRLTLVVKLVCDRILGSKDVGEVQVPVLELLISSPSFNGDGQGTRMRFVTYQVSTPCGKGKGSLTFSYRFDTMSCNPDVPVSPVQPIRIGTSYSFPSTNYLPASVVYPPWSQSQEYSAPSYPHQPVTGYPPPHHHYDQGIMYPPPPSYHQLQQSQSFHGYPTSSSGYAHGSPPRPRKNKKGVGLGTRALLLGGALGGLLLENLVSDIGFDLQNF
ncbi:Calcium-dependent lipid-binding (CaLB domain) family protein [Raphanus sativus]|uniref:Protein SRC2-like n=1 Tax=Raphanus sativus TaxID=3726 RepID=A0A6J0JRY5_RAPSA|nr:protein SRC2-like [Raphanus sativus]KAJ4886636.1 Calcium-dependent lipid-binding (CaLB domain) family protein [Raphanus sativus]